MVALIILVICLTFLSAFWAEKKLDASFLFLDFDVIYLHFLEEEENKNKKQEIKFVAATIIDINIKKMIKIEQKLKKYKKIINNKDSSSYEIWLADGITIKLKKEWMERYNDNKAIIKKIKN